MSHEKGSDTLFDLAFYDLLMRDLEFYDAEAIETRNRTKSVSWVQYKKYYRDKLEKCDNRDCAENIFLRFADGFVNLHSQFKIQGYTDSRILEDSVYRAQPSIGVEYPSLECYDLTTSRKITHLNSVPVKDALNYFINYECRFNSESGCVSNFVQKLNANWLTIGDRALEKITYANGSVSYITFNKQKRPQPIDNKKKFAVSMKDWEVVTEGHRFILMRRDKTLVLKYVDFNYDEMGGDIYCEVPAAKNSMCHDMQLLTESIRRIGSVHTLVIDLQNNFGGAEVTPLIVALAKRPFYDLSIRFRKTASLENDTIRPYLFWFNPRLENWFSTLRKHENYKTLAYGDFLPPCADFCRGSANCEMKTIKPARKLDISGIILVTNYYCLSSCDDFAWRMRDYADARITGQPHAADATFSRIKLAYYYNHGRIYRKEYGPGQAMNETNLFFSATVPNSATVSGAGDPIQGIPAKLDYEVPIVQDHYKDIEIYTLSKVLKQYGLIE